MISPTFLPGGGYDLSTVEKREAAAEACLRFIAVIPQAYFNKGPEYCRDQMERTAREMVQKLAEAREKEVH